MVRGTGSTQDSQVMYNRENYYHPLLRQGVKITLKFIVKFCFYFDKKYDMGRASAYCCHIPTACYRQLE